MGIGTTDPDSALHVVGGAHITGGLKVDGGIEGLGQIWSENGNDIYYNLGNVGIGTDSPSASLDVDGTSEFNGAINNNNNWISGDGDDEGIYINNFGRVGIGTNSPDSWLHVKYTDPGSLLSSSGIRIQNGSHFRNIVAEDNNGDEDLEFVFNNTRKAAVDENSGDWVSLSDRRHKTNIRESKYGLESVMAIEVSDYQFKDDPDNNDQTGFIAQQLYEVYPPAVAVGNDEPDGQFWGVAYGALTPLLVKGMQEQQEMIDELRIENEELRAKVNEIDELRAMIEALQN